MSTPPSGKKALLNGLMLKCPQCGIGRLFKSYLKQQEDCPHCNESFVGIRADDGPAWLTILLTGHIVVPIYLLQNPGDQPPSWLEILFMLSLTTVTVLLLLPPTKGLFIAALWLIRQKRAEPLLPKDETVL